MSRRRRRGPSDGRVEPKPPDGPRPAAPPPTGVAPGRARVSLPAVLRVTFERAADMAKRGLASHGRIGPMVFFSYGEDQGLPEGSFDTFKGVPLNWRTPLQKETIKRRIMEKARAEGASAVVVLTKSDLEGAGARTKDATQQKGTLVFSGATTGARASGRVTYVLERQTKALTSWEMSLSAEAGDDFFLEGIFPAHPRSPS